MMRAPRTFARVLRHAALLGASALLLGACGDDGGTPAVDVTLQFAAVVGDRPFACDETFMVGTPAAEVRPLDFRLYVHDVALLSAEGDRVAVTLTDDGAWQHDDVALLDFEDRSGTCQNGTTETRSVVVGTVPPGDYAGVSFRVGVPEDLNHNDAAKAPSPLNLTSLFWIWRDGYKFLRIDAETVASDTPSIVHLGSTGCEGDPPSSAVTCARPNRPAVRFDAFDVAADVIELDYGALVAGIDPENDAGGEAGCMSAPSDPECASVFEALGLDLDSGEPADGPAAFFRVKE